MLWYAGLSLSSASQLELATRLAQPTLKLKQDLRTQLVCKALSGSASGAPPGHLRSVHRAPCGSVRPRAQGPAWDPLAAGHSTRVSNTDYMYGCTIHRTQVVVLFQNTEYRIQNTEYSMQNTEWHSRSTTSSTVQVEGS